MKCWNYIEVILELLLKWSYSKGLFITDSGCQEQQNSMRDVSKVTENN